MSDLGVWRANRLRTVPNAPNPFVKRRERLHAALDCALDAAEIKPFHGDLEQLTLANNDFRRVIFTGKHEQLVLMSLKPGENIGNEIHPDTDQFFRIEQGTAKFTLGNGNEVFSVSDGGGVVVPAGTWHDVRAGKDGVKLYTIYAPPNHPDGTVERTKAEVKKKEG
jgi:mannose-6-phosphate isomerase-like protein (cupin superfamily)